MQQNDASIVNDYGRRHEPELRTGVLALLKSHRRVLQPTAGPASCAVTLHCYCLSLAPRCLFTDFPWPPAATPLTFHGPPLPFRCLSLTFRCLSTSCAVCSSSHLQQGRGAGIGASHRTAFNHCIRTHHSIIANTSLHCAPQADRQGAAVKTNLDSVALLLHRCLFFDDCHTRPMLGPSQRERDAPPFLTLVAVFSFSLTLSLSLSPN